MPNLIRIFIILIILNLAVFSHARDVISGKVVGVSDGDTITFLKTAPRTGFDYTESMPQRAARILGFIAE